MNDSSVDQERLMNSARMLAGYRRDRARSRQRAIGVLDAMAAEARRFLGAAFTGNDPVTKLPVALVVRSDERLPDDYEQQTPRPPADTMNRLFVEVLGRALTIEMDDAGSVHASGDAPNVPLASVTGVRVAESAPNAATFLVVGGDDRKRPTEIPFVRALADLIDAVAQGEARFAVSAVPPGAERERVSVAGSSA